MRQTFTCEVSSVSAICRWVRPRRSRSRARPAAASIALVPASMRSRRSGSSFRDLTRSRHFGSPPHAWGPYARPGLEPAECRFTPTRVGTISLCSFPCAHDSVHPHTRGDHTEQWFEFLDNSGSPPHAWGPSRRPSRFARRERFTPTRVGTITFAVRSYSPRSVHPHTRGDHH